MENDLNFWEILSWDQHDYSLRSERNTNLEIGLTSINYSVFHFQINPSI
jgi:hypothetical protein